MKTKSVKPTVYLVVALMLATSITYLVVAVEESSEISSSSSNNNGNTGSIPSSNNNNDNTNEKSLSNTEEVVETKIAAEVAVGVEGAELLYAQIETTLFAAAAGYLSVSVCMLKMKQNTKAPYLIAIVGSLSLVILYVISRMISLLIVGLQEDIGFMDIMSKILQGGIITGCLYILMSYYSRPIAKDMTTTSSR